ncbi:MAG: NAD-dependent epimerase/dehydratase family protein [Candidatus Saccharimonas sp.]|nr:NAD-dependent epimerase/dehydratase family protein [Planctomycetaceae bacterium]
MTIRWITDRLGTAPYDQFQPLDGSILVDVRDMVDKVGNATGLAYAKVAEGAQALQAGLTVIVCCDYGISRSNSIAAGVLAKANGIPFDQAMLEVIAKTGERSMQTGVVRAVRDGLEATETAPSSGRLLVTGATGVLGTALREHLGDRCDWVVPTRSEIDLLSGSVELELRVRATRPKVIVHFANPRIYTVTKALGDSLVMLKNVIEVCVLHGLPLVFPSSWEVFSGYRSNGMIVSAETPRLPGETNGQAKFLAETLLEHHVRHSGLKLTLLRSCPIYGRGDRPKFIHHFIQKALRGDDIQTHRYLNGEPSLDLLHMDDAVRLLDAVLANPPGGVIQMGTGRGTSTTQVAEKIVAMTGSQSQIGHRDIAGYAPNVVMDTSRARELYGWEPEVGIDEGLERLVAANH